MASQHVQKLLEQHTETNAEQQVLLQCLSSYGKKLIFPGEYERRELLLEVIEDAVKFAMGTGMAAKDVNTFFRIFTTVLASFIQKGNPTSLEISVRVLKDCLLSSQVPISQTLSHHTTSYITQTLLQHFNLYQYLLNHQQQECHTHLQMPVETCDKNLPPLVDGLEESEWEKKDKVRKIEEQHILKERLMEEERQESLRQERNEIEKIEQGIIHTLQGKDESGFTEGDIKDMTLTLVEARTRQLVGSLNYEMSQKEGKVGVRVESLDVQVQSQPGPRSPTSSKKQSPHAKSPASGRTSGRKL